LKGRNILSKTLSLFSASIFLPENVLTYRKRVERRYSPTRRSRSRVATATLKTKKWGKISYPKGTKPLVVEVKGDASSQIDGLGFRRESDVEQLKKALEKKGKTELQMHEKADFTIHFPKSKRKPVKFSVVGEQPITPPVIHHPSWPPSEEVVRDIKEEMRKNPNRKTASDLEAMAYLNTASSAAPMSEQWNRIYFYLTRKYLKNKGWKKFEGGMDFLDQHKTLSEYDERELKHLKEWIFRDQQKVLKEREKQAKTLRKE
jgi:hypothetical protein